MTTGLYEGGNAGQLQRTDLYNLWVWEDVRIPKTFVVGIGMLVLYTHTHEVSELKHLYPKLSCNCLFLSIAR